MSVRRPSKRTGGKRRARGIRRTCRPEGSRTVCPEGSSPYPAERSRGPRRAKWRIPRGAKWRTPRGAKWSSRALHPISGANPASCRLSPLDTRRQPAISGVGPSNGGGRRAAAAGGRQGRRAAEEAAGGGEAVDPAATRGTAAPESGGTGCDRGGSWLTVVESGVRWSAMEPKWWKQLA